jgi:fatty acid desaturase
MSRLSKWAADIRAIQQTKLTPETQERSFDHLHGIIRFNNVLFYFGLLFSFLDVTYVFPWVMMGLSISSHWTTVSHHISHGGYTRKYDRFTYGKKIMRRVVDWMDYILPEAWHCEHNVHHHYKLNEFNDPDNVQHNLAQLRALNVPNFLKYGIIAVFALTWRLLYYSPNSYKYYKASKLKYEMKAEDYKQMTLAGFFLNEWPTWVSRSEYFFQVLFPLFFYRALAFFPFYAVHAFYSDFFTATHLYNVLLNYVFADLFCNIHTFAIIVPNHAGDDMYLYRSGVTAKSDEWLLRQCISSANYVTGHNAGDYLQGWLNYQIEHHLFPDLSAYEYQLIHKDVKRVCEKHGVPYTSESVFLRLWKTVKIMTGQASIPYYEGSDLEKFMNELHLKVI